MSDADPLAAPPAPPAVDAAQLDPETRAALVAYLYALADDELLIGHRDSEWTGLGPILEEDIAFSSMAQDELGHALVWYKLLTGLGEPEPDASAFLRPVTRFRNARLVELPRGDYATSLVRQYLFDLGEALRYDALGQSTWAPMAEAATKLRQEEKYHLIHGRAFIERLGHATEESRARLQAALDALFAPALGLWEPVPGEARLVERGIVPDSARLAADWLTLLVPFMERCGLRPAVHATTDGGWLPAVAPLVGGRTGSHGPELGEALDAMQALFRSDPEARW